MWVWIDFRFRLATVKAMKHSEFILFLTLRSARGCISQQKEGLYAVYFYEYYLLWHFWPPFKVLPWWIVLLQPLHGSGRPACLLVDAAVGWSKWLCSAQSGSQRFLVLFGVQSWFWGWVLLMLTGGWRHVLSESDTLCSTTMEHRDSVVSCLFLN